MQYYNLIIATKTNVKIDDSYDVLYLHNDIMLLDSNHVMCNNSIYEFTYLIYSKTVNPKYKDNTLLVLEDNVPVCNFLHQTSIDYIYYIEEDSNELVNEIINYD